MSRPTKDEAKEALLKAVDVYIESHGEGHSDSTFIDFAVSTLHTEGYEGISKWYLARWDNNTPYWEG